MQVKQGGKIKVDFKVGEVLKSVMSNPRTWVVSVSDRIKKRKIILVVLSALTLVGWIVFTYVNPPPGSLLAPFMFLLGFVMTNT